MKSWKVESRSPEQTQQLGAALGRLCPDSFALLLEGDLGSGKTCLVQGVAEGLGVPPEVAVNSPTYTLMNQYAGRVEISHFDLYRLGDADELIELDFDAYLHGPGVTIVEWSGIVDRKGVQGLQLQLDYGKTEDERTILVTAMDPVAEKCLAELAETWKGSEY